MRSIRRTRYGSCEHPITLAFFSGIEGHPELVDSTPPPIPPQPKAERAPAMTETFIRKVLGRPRRPTAQEAQRDLHYRRVMQPIEREGA
jgi:hypothetical protein